jgi:hypothetical protein
MLVTLGFFFWAAEREVPRQSPRVPLRLQDSDPELN